jgi:hypothetical protein
MVYHLIREHVNILTLERFTFNNNGVLCFIQISENILVFLLRELLSLRPYKCLLSRKQFSLLYALPFDQRIALTFELV